MRREAWRKAGGATIAKMAMEAVTMVIKSRHHTVQPPTVPRFLNTLTPAVRAAVRSTFLSINSHSTLPSDIGSSRIIYEINLYFNDA